MGVPREALLPDATRAEVASRNRELASLLERALPNDVTVTPPYDFECVASLLLIRLAGQSRAVAALIDADLDLEARMVMRSALEHLILLAWLSVDGADLPSDVTDRRARTPEENARWWVSDQLRRQQRRIEDQVPAFGLELDEEVRAGLKASKTLFKEERGWGEPPGVEAMARAADARWGGVLDGWPSVSFGHRDYGRTLHGFFLSLFQSGNASVHPNLGGLIDTFASGHIESEGRAALRPEQVAHNVAVDVAMTPYLLLYAVGLAERMLSWTCMDEALEVLGRFESVRGPGLLLALVSEVLGGQDGGRYGSVDGTSLSVEHSGGDTTVVVVEDEGTSVIRHRPGPIWTFQLNDDEPMLFGAEDMEGVVVIALAHARHLIAKATWQHGDEAARSRPQGAP